MKKTGIGISDAHCILFQIQEAKEWAVAESIVQMIQEDDNHIRREELQQEPDQKR